MAITYDEISFIILLFGLLCLFIKKKKQIPGLRNIKIMALIVFIYNLSSAFMGLLTEAMWFSPDFSKACSYIHNCMFFTSCYYLPSFIGLIILDRCNAHHAKHWLFFLPPTLMEIFFFIVNSKTGRIFEISAVTTGYRHGSKFYHFVYDYGDLMWTTYLILVFFYIDDPYDDMTGLYNRRGFIRATEDTVALSRGKMNMILVRDVINFQDVNERFGRDIGDEAIIGISRKLYEKYHNDINHNMKKALANKEFKVYFQPIYDSHSKKIIISSIMDMTDRLDMPIITEGVENEQQYNYLKSLKCVQIQGFYFSTPVPKEEFEKLLLENEL